MSAFQMLLVKARRLPSAADGSSSQVVPCVRARGDPFLLKVVGETGTVQRLIWSLRRKENKTRSRAAVQHSGLTSYSWPRNSSRAWVRRTLPPWSGVTHQSQTLSPAGDPGLVVPQPKNSRWLPQGDQIGKRADRK